MNSVIGHEAVLQFFDRVRAAGQMNHAYCFVGREHVGRRRVAEEIAASVLKVPRKALAVTPDYTFVGQEINEKTGKTRKEISIDQIRKLKTTMSMRSYLGGYKVAVIDQAEKLNQESGNAFLKTLEEPGDKTLLLLLATDESQLPETVRSRCQMLYFHAVETQKIEQALLADGASETTAREMSRLCQGLPGLAVEWLADTETYESYRQEIFRFADMVGKPLAEKIKHVEPLFESGDDHIAARLYLKNVLSLWQMILREGVAPSLDATSRLYQVAWREPVAPAVYLHIQSHIDRAKDYLEENIHPRLLVEPILAHIP